MPELTGFSHIDLTVTDCDEAARWWQDVLGFVLVHKVQEPTFRCRSLIHASGIAVTVMTHDATSDYGPFDERRVGLDHLAFRVADRSELQKWATHLDAKRVTSTGIIDTGYGPTLVFRDPDNTQLELYVQPNPDDLSLTDADSEEARQALHSGQ